MERSFLPQGDGKPAILIAAQSGRALAEAARQAGYRPYVADIFGDSDTLELAAAYHALPGRFGSGRVGGEALLAALDALSEAAGGQAAGIVLGSGFEGAPDLMAGIACRHRLLGARPEAVAALKDPLRFAALCADLAIPTPAVALEPRPDPENWLRKAVGGSGGSHIRRAGRGPAPRGAYFQARVPGRAFALNLLADGRDIRVLALTEQWSAAAPARPYRYAGALARGVAEPCPVAPEVVAEIRAAAAGLVARTGLAGLASLDCLIGEGGWWLTEVNPRPGATLDLLDRRAAPLLSAHIAASLGDMPPADADPADAAASEICYADRDIAPVPALTWPDHVRDRPRPGTSVRRDAPFCTVLATGPEAGATKDALRVRVDALRAVLALEEARV